MSTYCKEISCPPKKKKNSRTKVAICTYRSFVKAHQTKAMLINHELLSAERRCKQLFSHKTMQPRTFKKAFRASMGQRRFSLLFTWHCAPRRFSTKRRFHFAPVVEIVGNTWEETTPKTKQHSTKPTETSPTNDGLHRHA